MTPKLWCVRADGGTYTQHFVKGGYAAIGWSELATDLTSLETLEEMKALYRQVNPDVTSNLVVGLKAGQAWRFVREVQAGDFIVTPAAESGWLHYGQVAEDPSYSYEPAPTDGCRYHHRRRIEWSKDRLHRSDLSVPFQNGLRAMLTVYEVKHADEFLAAIGRSDLVPPRTMLAVGGHYDAHRVVLERILELDATEFEVLVTHLLGALGFEGSETVGKTGDGGVDATGVLDVSNLAQIRIFVQVKRYALERAVRNSDIRKLRSAIPMGGQGAFITTSRYRKEAHEIANEHGFPRIGLINGHQLVDLLVEHWSDIPEEFQEQLGLKPGLILV